MELMASMDERVKQVIQVFPAAKDPQDQMVRKEILVQRETLERTVQKEKKEDPDLMVVLDVLETTAHLDQRETKEEEVQTETRERGVMMVHQEEMVDLGSVEFQERRVNKDPEETADLGERLVILGVVVSLDVKDQLGQMEIQVSLVGQGCQVTVETKDKQDQRDLKGPEASKDRQETGALWVRGEKMVVLGMELQVVMDSRVIQE